MEQQHFTDIDSEQTLCCQLILNNSILHDVYNTVKPETFTNNLTKKIYEYLYKNISEGNLVSKEQVIKDMSSAYPKNIVEILEIPDKIGTTENWNFYAEKIENCYIARETKRAAQKIVEDITPLNAKEKNKELTKQTSKILEKNTETSSICSNTEMCKKLMDDMDFFIANKGKLLGLDTGFEMLNSVFHGFSNEIYVLGARPSVGKTSLALQFAVSIASQVKTDFYSLEMSSNELGLKEMSMLAGVKSDNIKMGSVTMQETQKIQQALSKMFTDIQLNVVEDVSNIDKLTESIRYRVKNLGIKAILIDHFSLISHSNPMLPRPQQYTEISNKLRALQKELKIPFIIIAQLGRASEEKEPTLADLRESGALEQDAHNVIMMHRNRKDGAKGFLSNTFITVLKNRNGRLAYLESEFNMATSKFGEMKERDFEEEVPKKKYPKK